MTKLVLAALCLTAIVSAQEMDDGMEMGMGAGKGVSFERDVLPLLRESCFECHSDAKRKPKGALRVDGRSWILVGGEGGPAVIAGKPDRSPLYRRATLPDDHDDVMPPNGEVFEKDQLAVIRKWIEEGAEFGKWKGKQASAGAPVAGPTRTTEQAPRGADRYAIYRTLNEGVGAPPGAAIKKLQDAGARVAPVYPGSRLLRVEVVREAAATDDSVTRLLTGLRQQIAMLSLAHTSVTDRAMTEIAKMPRLVRLDLQKTAITDAGLRTLAKSKPAELRRLNLYGTAVTDKGLANLTLPKLQRLYLWETKVTAMGATDFGQRHPDCRVVASRELPAAPTGNRQQGNNRRRGKKKK